MSPLTKTFGGNKIAKHDGKIGCNTVEYTTTFLYSEWLYFLWHGINAHIKYIYINIYIYIYMYMYMNICIYP